MSTRQNVSSRLFAGLVAPRLIFSPQNSRHIHQSVQMYIVSQAHNILSCLLIHRKTPEKAEFEGETKAFRHSKTSLTTARGLVNGIFLGHLRDLLLWLWSSGRTATSRQVSRHGGVAGMLRSKSTDTRAGPTEALVLRFSLAESCGFFAEASPFGRCPRSTGGSDVRPQGD